MDYSSSSDDENIPYNSILKIDWLDLSLFGFHGNVALSGLPGYKHKETIHNLRLDLDTLKESLFTDVFVLCSENELKKFKVKKLLQLYEEESYCIHCHSIVRGSTPEISDLVQIINKINLLIGNGKKIFIHCVGGLGRSCLVAACFLLHTDCNKTADEVINEIRLLKGPGAIQTVRQYNFIHEFRSLWDEHHFFENDENISVSR